MNTLAVFFLAAAAIGGVAWVFVYPILSGERKTEQRMASVARTAPTARVTRNTQRSRRDAIESTLKEFEERQKKNKRASLSIRIAQAGLSWSKRQFVLISGAVGVFFFLVGISTGAGLIAAVALAFAGAFGAPLWACRI
jgi:tight adherence protein B